LTKLNNNPLELIKRKLFERPALKKILKNVGWLTVDRILQLVVALLVGIWIARYLGPTDFGLMNFAFAFVTLFSPFVGLGIQSLLVREFLHQPEKKNELLGTAFWIQIVTGIIAMLIMNVAILILRPNDFLSFLVVFVYSFNNLALSLDMLTNWFDSRVESKKVVMARTGGMIFSNLLKIGFMLFGFSVIYFILASVIETLLTGLFMLYSYIKTEGSIKNWKFDFGLAKKLFSSSWPLILSGAMVIIYMKIDQVMIGLLLSDAQVGIYSVAVKFATMFLFLPAAISVSLFPSIVNSKKISQEVYYSRFQKLFDLMTWVPMTFVIPLFLFSNLIVVFLYGAEYSLAGPTLAILIWSAVATSVKFAVEKYLINENKTKIIFSNALIGAVVNVIFNLALIPVFGILGAAVATLISYTASSYLGLLLYPSTRKIFFMLMKSFNIIRIIKEYRNYSK
jgi:O-antigen/teichoic acid export membrane protein